MLNFYMFYRCWLGLSTRRWCRNAWHSKTISSFSGIIFLLFKFLELLLILCYEVVWISRLSSLLFLKKNFLSCFFLFTASFFILSSNSFCFFFSKLFCLFSLNGFFGFLFFTLLLKLQFFFSINFFLEDIVNNIRIALRCIF